MTVRRNVVHGFNTQPYRRKRLKGYYARYSKDNPSELWDNNVADVLEQQGFQPQSEPRSVYSVAKLYEALYAFSPDRRPWTRKDKFVTQGISFAYKAFSRPSDVKPFKVSAFNVEFIDSIVSKPKASAGLTAWGMTKAETEVRAYYRGKQIMSGQKSPEPCIALARTQKNGKTRLVWGYPFSMTAIEGLIARPLIDFFKGGTFPMAFGMSRGAMGAKIRCSSYSNYWAYSVDVHQFDASASSYLIKVAFNILKTWFDLSQEVPNTGLTVNDVFEIIEKYFITTPIVMPDGMVYYGKRHGVPSGSYFTQMIDSLINTIYIGSISSRFGLAVSTRDVSVLGDDSLFWSNRKVALHKIASYASRAFDAEFQPAKSHRTRHTQPVRYLGTYWYNGRPTLPIQEIVNKATQPERFRKYSNDPEERKRQVSLIILSYASVYHNFFWPAMKILGYSGRYNETMLSVFLRALGSEPEYDPKYMSGYQRYLIEHHLMDAGFNNDPILSMWK